MIDPQDLATRAVDELGRLIAFDTTSRDSNLDLIAHVESLLGDLGVASRRVSKADGGIVLSGHTDVVPVDGQAWTSDPFRLQRREDRLYGRGTCDMKGFLALA